MRPRLETISSSEPESSLVAYRHIVPRFEFAWHYHPEVELTYIICGTGKRLVGDCYQDFGPGDLVLLGANLPHTWDSTADQSETSEAIVIQFLPDRLAGVLALPEMQRIGHLLEAAKVGLHFLAPTVGAKMEALPSVPPALRLLELLSVLQTLAKESAPKQVKALASALYKPLRGQASGTRINTICRYIHTHSYEDLPLSDIASQAHLTPAAFCKFFKRATGKTFSDYLNDIRIARACQLLTEEDTPVADVAHICGYDTLTYFNRVFKQKKGITPRLWRQQSSRL